MPLLSTKLHIPEPCSNLVPRSHLLARLNEGLELGHKLILVSAPAGFGKSNLLSEWAARVEVRKKLAWLSLEDDDNRPTRFWAYFIAALQSVLAELGEASMALLRSVELPSSEAILTPLLNEIAAQPERVVLVLDDYHLISRNELHGGVSFLIDHLPTQLHLVISTRADPPLPIVRLRARGQLTELRGDDLRFTPRETSTFLNSKMGLQLSEADIKVLDARLEGWIAGLQLAAISLRNQTDRHEFIVSFASSPYYALEYLAQEVLGGLPAGTLDFVTKTSILTQLGADLCDQVTGRNDGAAMLDRLYHGNLFVNALDIEHRWYRYHQLFADLLQNRLQQQMDDEAIANLHRRASEWHEENGYLQVAVRHAQAAGDMERVADLAEKAAQASLLDSWMTDLLAWLEILPEDLLRSKLRLRIYQACALFFDGQDAACVKILDESKQAIRELPASAENDSVREELSQLIEIAYAFVDILALSMRGKLDQSMQVTLRAKRLAEAAGNTFLVAHAYEGLALNQFHRGHLGEAASTCAQLVELAGGNLREARLDQPLPIASAGYLLMANICLDRNRLDEMGQHLAQAFMLCRMSGGAKSLVEAYVMQSRLQQARGDVDSAYQSLSEAERAYALKASKLTRFRLESQRARLDVGAGALEDAANWLRGLGMEDAEGKSTMPLPTMLSEAAQLIRARLYLARHDPEEALRVLEVIHSPAELEGRGRHMMEIYTLKGLAFQALDRGQEAMEQIERALHLGEEEGFVRVFLDCVFLDEGVPTQRLLYKAVDDGILPAYAGKLLAAFPEPVKDKRESKGEALEPLSQREIEVLQLIARGLSNRQVAQELVISLDTVKTHTSNIYGKLGVNNRTQAAIKAKALGVI